LQFTFIAFHSLPSSSSNNKQTKRMHLYLFSRGIGSGCLLLMMLAAVVDDDEHAVPIHFFCEARSVNGSCSVRLLLVLLFVALIS